MCIGNIFIYIGDILFTLEIFYLRRRYFYLRRRYFYLRRRYFYLRRRYFYLHRRYFYLHRRYFNSHRKYFIYIGPSNLREIGLYNYSREGWMARLRTEISIFGITGFMKYIYIYTVASIYISWQYVNRLLSNPFTCK